MQRGGTRQLADVVGSLRATIEKYRGARSFNEQNTKASLIVPVLEALGWNTNDPGEVHWEYRLKPKHNPVDFALLLKRTPCLFLEAKALRESLAEDKLVAQILTYASVAGVQWVVLSNGDEYRIYNANAPVPAEEKLFRAVSIASDPPETVIATLSLLSQANLQEKKIGRLWESHFIDRQVRLAVERLLDPAEPASALVRAIRALSDGKLRDAEIRASLRRSRLQLDFPKEPEVAIDAGGREAKEERRTKRKVSGIKKSTISLQDLIAAGIIRPPVEIYARYRDQDLRATIESDGCVQYNKQRFESLSAAGGAARKPFHTGDLKGLSNPATNGWTFWSFNDRDTGSALRVDVLRDRYLEGKHAEARRFTESS